MNRRIVVVGAGISGLAAAWRLAGSAEVLCLDADTRAGGKVLSRNEDGHLLEYGPSSLLAGKPELAALVRDLGLDAEVVESRAAAKRRYVLLDGRLEELPMGPGAFLGSRILPLGAKVRILAEPFCRAGRAEESVAAFFRRRLGPKVVERLVDPFVSGIYAGDVERLSATAAFPSLVRMEQEHGSLFRGGLAALRAKRAKSKGNGDAPPARRGLFSFRTGVSRLTERLGQLLDSRLRTGARVRGLARLSDGRWSIAVESGGRTEALEADVVVLACPAPAAAGLLHELAAPAAEALAGMAYAPVALRFLSYRAEDLKKAPHGGEGFGFLVPSREGEKALGCLWSSRIFEARAPEGRFCCTVYLGGAREPGLARLPDEDRSAIARELVARTLGAPEQPLQEWGYVWNEAIPQLELGHPDRVERAHFAGRTMPGLYLVGAHMGGVSLPDCVVTAEREVARVRAYLESGGARIG